MPGSHFARSIVLLLCGALAAFGCASTDTERGATGSLSLDLVLAGNIEIDVVDWQISGNGMDMGGSVDVSGPGSTASVEVYGLPVGQEPYMVELSAVSVDQQVTCRGSAEFDVEVGVSTPVMVILNCKLPQELGGVRVNGKFNICAQLTKMVVAPLQTSVGNDISLFSTASDEEGDPITYMWSSQSGSIADPMAASTTYTCTEVGDDDITVLVTDDDGSYCMSMWTVRVTCVAGDGNPCDDVTCEDDGNECTAEACNPGTGQCESSNVADGTECDGGTCAGGVCVEVDLCEGVDCDDNNECTADACDPADGTCGSTNVDNGTPCNNDEGVCSDGSCVECNGDSQCPDDGNECTAAACESNACVQNNVMDGQACDFGGSAGICEVGACVAAPECISPGDCNDGNPCTVGACPDGMCVFSPASDGTACDVSAGVPGTCTAGDCVGLCENVDCSNNNQCRVDPTCDPADGQCKGGSDEPINTPCDQGGGQVCDDAGRCVECNSDGQCDVELNEACVENVCQPNAEVFYFQDFNQLDIGGGVIGDGWAYFVNVFATPFYNYGGPAPNGPQISALVAGQGGPDQEPQQLSVYSDYNNQDHGNGILIETNVFQEPFGFNNRIPQSEVDKTYTFSFQAKQGNINDPADVNCAAPNVCDVTANAFIKTLDPDAGFQTSDSDVVDTTAVGSTWTGYTLTLDITQDRVGDLLQFGFQTNATNFEPSGNFYDNVLVTVE